MIVIGGCFGGLWEVFFWGVFISFWGIIWSKEVVLRFCLFFSEDVELVDIWVRLFIYFIY